MYRIIHKFTSLLLLLSLCAVQTAYGAVGDDACWREAESYPVNVPGASNAYLEVLWSRESADLQLRLTLASAALREELPDGYGVSLVFYGANGSGSEVCFLSGEDTQLDAGTFEAEGRVEHYPREGSMRLTLQVMLLDPKAWGEALTCDAVVLTPEGGSRAFAQKPLVLVLPTTAKPTTTKPPRATNPAKQRTTKPKTAKRVTSRQKKAAAVPKSKDKTTKERVGEGALLVEDTEPVKKTQVKYLLGITAVLVLLFVCYGLFTHSKRVKKKESGEEEPKE